ncbi:MAG: class I SAM-dependent methyltransferase [Actinomycetota bacterium]|nr:class I SAM-dependent methyltransferase [Actinomycetota bacterium]
MARFESAYAGMTPLVDRRDPQRPPWEIGAPQASIVDLAERGQITGKVLDVGCGTGENSLFLTGRGMDVVGIDASTIAVEAARAKATERSVGVEFRVSDALHLRASPERFDSVIDVGLLHLFSDIDRRHLIDGLHTVLRPGGVYHVLCFSLRRSPPAPRRLGYHELLDAFGPGWRVESLVESHYDVLDGDPRANAWLGRILRLR